MKTVLLGRRVSTRKPTTNTGADRSNKITHFQKQKEFYQRRLEGLQNIANNDDALIHHPHLQQVYGDGVLIRRAKVQIEINRLRRIVDFLESRIELIEAIEEGGKDE
jgi:pterin-4a-carbinolamine dehydratase